MQTIGTYLLDFVLAVLLGLFMKYVVPYLKSKITTENLSFIKGWVEDLVAAAEQTITGSKMGSERKAWVISMLEKLGIVVDDTVDALIEAAVLALKSTVNVLSEAVISGVKEVTGGAITEDTAEKAVEAITGQAPEQDSEETAKQEV